MKKPDLNKHWLEILMVVSGVLMLAVSFLADAVGLGGQAGFGERQTALAVLGSGMLLAAGVMLRARRRGWTPRITFLEAAQGPVTIAEGNMRFYKQLSREVSTPSSTRSVLISVVGTIFAVLVANLAALWYLDHYSTNRGPELVEQKWKILQNMQTPVDWLVLGDSTGNQGVVPETLESKLGGTAANLCTIVPMTTLDDAMMLDVYIDKFGPPDNVLIVHSYDILPVELSPLVFAKIPLPWGISHRYRFSPALIGVKEQIQVSVARHFPLYFENRTLKSIISNGIKSPNTLFASEFHLDLTPQGYMPMMEARPQDVEEDAKGHIEFLKENDFVVSDINHVAIDHIITLADHYAINVYITTGPLYKGFYESRVFQDLFSEIQGWWSEVANRSERVHYLALISTFSSDQMQEVDHATHAAAEIYTEEISSEIINVQQSRIVREPLGEH